MQKLDNEGYPTDELLEWIEQYDLTQDGVEPLLEVLEEIWYFGDWGFKRTGAELELHTGGWSGNESVIGALKANMLFWPLYWKRQDRGGHFYFDKLDREIGGH